MRDHSLVVACTAGAFTKAQHEFLYDNIRQSQTFVEMTTQYISDDEAYDEEYTADLEELRDGFILQIQHQEFSKHRFDIVALSKALPTLVIFKRHTDHGGATQDESFLDGQEITFAPPHRASTEILASLRAYARSANQPWAPPINPSTAQGLEAMYPTTSIRYRRHWTTDKRFEGRVHVISLDSPPASYLNKYRDVPYTAGNMRTEDGRILRFHCQYQNIIGSNSIADAADFHQAYKTGEQLQINGEIITTKFMPTTPGDYHFSEAFGTTRIMDTL